MRFDTPVYFQSVQAGAYDPTTGDYGPDVQAEDMRRRCSLSMARCRRAA